MNFNFKKTSVSIVLTLIIMITMMLPVISAEASVTIKVALKNPIVLECVGKTENGKWSLTADEQNQLSNALANIAQPAYDAFIADNPKEAMWIDIGASSPLVSYSYVRNGNKYIVTASEISQTVVSLPDFPAPKAMIDQLEDIVDGFKPFGVSLYDKVKSIHDYVCFITEYDNTLKAPNTYSAYGSLIRRKSVCEGYAEAFKLLCDKNGIECILVTGIATNSNGKENHMWCYVKMDDGYWYAVDPTWDDGSKTGKDYFLVGSDTVVTKTGKKFIDNHAPDGDISDTNLKIFDLPTLSKKSYAENNDITLPSSFTGKRENRYFYNQLNSEQKNFYDKLIKIVPPLGTNSAPEIVGRPDFPPVTDTETTTDTVTTPPETETATDAVTTPAETETTADPVTTPKETETDLTTTPSDTTPAVTETDTVTDETVSDDSTTVTDRDTSSDSTTPADSQTTSQDTSDTESTPSTTVRDTDTDTDSTAPATDTDTADTTDEQASSPSPKEEISIDGIISIAVIVIAVAGLFIGIVKIITKVKE